MLVGSKAVWIKASGNETTSSKMLKRQRGSRLAALAMMMVTGCVCRWCWAPAPGTFVQTKVAQQHTELAQQHGAAVLGGLVPLVASFPAEAAGGPGPLAGSEVCKPGIIFSIIAPLCDLIWLVDPVYLYPLFLIIICSIVLPLQLLIPALQPDEDLR